MVNIVRKIINSQGFGQSIVYNTAYESIKYSKLSELKSINQLQSYVEFDNSEVSNLESDISKETDLYNSKVIFNSESNITDESDLWLSEVSNILGQKLKNNLNYSYDYISKNNIYDSKLSELESINQLQSYVEFDNSEVSEFKSNMLVQDIQWSSQLNYNKQDNIFNLDASLIESQENNFNDEDLEELIQIIDMESCYKNHKFQLSTDASEDYTTYDQNDNEENFNIDINSLLIDSAENSNLTNPYYF